MANQANSQGDEGASNSSQNTEVFINCRVNYLNGFYTIDLVLFW